MVFVDSNVWISYLNKEDKHHNNAIRVLSKIRAFETIFVSSGIVHEVVNYLFKISGKKTAKAALDFFLSTPSIEIILLNESAWIRTIELFNEYEISLTDAQIVAVMEKTQDKELYSFDKHFDKVKSIIRKT